MSISSGGVGDVRKLSQVESHKIRASSMIGGYHTIAEELILNAIDAKAKNIEIICDLHNHMMQIVDDGDGITEESFHRLGQWHETSKFIDTSSYGFKGEALAAISMIANVEITSKSRMLPRKTYAVNINQGNYLSLPVCDRLSQGTTVKVTGIFESLPVRQISSRISIELNRIKEFVQKMSMLHHSISWLLVDSGMISTGTLSPIRRRMLYQSSSQPSVASQFIRCHSRNLFQTLKVR